MGISSLLLGNLHFSSWSFVLFRERNNIENENGIVFEFGPCLPMPRTGSFSYGLLLFNFNFKFKFKTFSGFLFVKQRAWLVMCNWRANKALLYFISSRFFYFYGQYRAEWISNVYSFEFSLKWNLIVHFLLVEALTQWSSLWYYYCKSRNCLQFPIHKPFVCCFLGYDDDDDKFVDLLLHQFYWEPSDKRLEISISIWYVSRIFCLVLSIIS